MFQRLNRWIGEHFFLVAGGAFVVMTAGVVAVQAIKAPTPVVHVECVTKAR